MMDRPPPSLQDALRSPRPTPSWGAPSAVRSGPDEDPGEAFRNLKSRFHQRLLERLNLSKLEEVERSEVEGALRRILGELVTAEGIPLNLDEREGLVRQVLDEIFGLGPLEPLLKDQEVSDILVNTHNSVWVERHGKLVQTQVRFQDEQHLRHIIERIVSGVGRRIDDSSPMVDARLPDGSRVNAVIPPVAIDGPHLSIRKFRRDALSGEDLVRSDALTADMLALLRGLVQARLNIVISGSTGAGKTTMLNILSSYIPSDERIITVEDSAELQLRQPHVVRMETRPPNIEGTGEITQRHLVINALRMRPDRIILGEVRGGEAVEMLQAMNTGHDGSLATLHANTPRDALSRLETMVSMANMSLPDTVVRRQIASAIHVVVQLARLSDGSRKVTSIAELAGIEGDQVRLQEIFFFDQEGVDTTGRVVGRFRASGIPSRYTDRMRTRGVSLAAALFQPDPGPTPPPTTEGDLPWQS